MDRTHIQDVADGLFVWRVPNPRWPQGLTSTCAVAGSETVVIDPLVPPDEVPELWRRLDALAPSMLVVLKPDHVRDVDFFARRYGVKAFGPWLFQRDDVPETDLAPIEPGSQLPGGLLALYDGRGRNETPLWLPAHRTIVFADAIAALRGELRVWKSPSHDARALPALRALLDLPFERVIVGHGEPVHSREAYERALSLPPIDGDAET
jgi:glyoxylase-like metal-dependent hydrolase (beta-lactamase superfamily II)